MRKRGREMKTRERFLDMRDALAAFLQGAWSI